MIDLNILPNGDLQVIADKEAHEEKKEILEMASADAFAYLTEEPCCNGWSIVPPEDIGALTDSPIITDEFDMNDEGEIIKTGNVWWFPDYAVQDEIALMFTKKGAIFTKAEKWEEEPTTDLRNFLYCGSKERAEHALKIAQYFWKNAEFELEKMIDSRTKKEQYVVLFCKEQWARSYPGESIRTSDIENLTPIQEVILTS